MQSIISELRRRNVFRVAAAYLVVGWLLIQITSLAMPALHLPDWTDTLVFFLLMLGFPVAMLLAWAFEMTPDGMKKTEAAEAGAGFRPLGTSDYLLITGVLVVVAVAGFQFFGPASTAPPPAPVATNPDDTGRPIIAASIAVLPFADLSPDGDQAYFGDGIAEEILNVLTRVDGLHVASRTSAFQFRGDALGLPAIARELNVRHIVEGSVRKSGDTLRITAQLIDANGDRHLWSDTYDRPLTAENIFAIQDEIATEIVAALSEALDMSPPDVSIATETANLDAYELYLRGQAIFHRRNFDNIPQGIDYFERAVVADPEFARGWAGLAAIYGVAEGWLGEDTDRDFGDLAWQAADRATRLNPDLALPYSVRSLVARERLEWTDAFAQSNAAIARDPSSANAWYFRGGVWLAAGYFDAAAADFTAALERDPAYSITRRHLAFAELYRGHTERALELYQQGVLEQQHSNANTMIPVYFARRDDVTALYHLAYVQEIYDDGANTAAWYRYFSDFNLSDEELDRMFSAIYFRENSSLEGYQFIGGEFTISTSNNHGLLWSPFEENRFRLASRQAFLAARHNVLAEMHLPEFWRENGFPPQCRPVGDDDFECDWIDDREVDR